jgi:hypothetical protein
MMATPGVLLERIDNAGFQRVVVNIADKAMKVFLFLDENGFVPTAEKRSVVPMPPIVKLRVNAPEMTHAPVRLPSGVSTRSW